MSRHFTDYEEKNFSYFCLNQERFYNPLKESKSIDSENTTVALKSHYCCIPYTKDILNISRILSW